MHLALSAPQRTLLSTILMALKDKGIGMGQSAWANAGLRMGISAVLKPHRKLDAKAAAQAQKEAEMTKMVMTAVNRETRPDPNDVFAAVNDIVKEGKSGIAAADVAKLAAQNGATGAIKYIQGEIQGGEDEVVSGVPVKPAEEEGSPRKEECSSRKPYDDLLWIYDSETGLEVVTKIGDALELVRSKIEKWEEMDFREAVGVFREPRDAVRPLIDQLKMTSTSLTSGQNAARDRAAIALVQASCLRVLQALLKGDKGVNQTMQTRLNDMGVTQVMVRALGTSDSDQTFEAALELGTALLEGGNVRVQQTIYRELRDSGTNMSLARLSQALNRQCRKIRTFFSEQEQALWYAKVLEPHLEQAREAWRSGRPFNSTQSLGRRGSMAALHQAVQATVAAGERELAEAAAAEQRRRNPFQQRRPERSAGQRVDGERTGVIDLRLACKVLIFIECATEGHYTDMQEYFRAQTGMRTQVNLVIDLVNNLLVLERTLSTLTISLTSQLYQTLTELVQGPCPGNQRFLIGTNLCDVAVRFMHGTYKDCELSKVIELKMDCLKLLLAMVEGQQSDLIPRRIASSLNFPKLIKEQDDAFERSRAIDKGWPHHEGEMDKLEQAYLQLGFYFFLLIKTLAKTAPSLLEYCEAKAKSHQFFAANTGAIEIVLSDKTLEEVYFPIPTLCTWLSENSITLLEQEVDRTTPQKRVEDFVKRSEDLIHEMEHNERVSHIWQLHLLAQARDRIRTAMFVLSIFMNFIILVFTVPETVCIEGPDPQGLGTGKTGTCLHEGEGRGDGDGLSGYWDVQFQPYWLGYVITFLGVVLSTLAFAALLAHCISTLPLTLRSAWAERGVKFDIQVIKDKDKKDIKISFNIEPLEETAKKKKKTSDLMRQKEPEEIEPSYCLGKLDLESKDKDMSHEKRDEYLKKFKRSVLLRTPMRVLLEDKMFAGYYLPYLTLCALGLFASPFCFVVTLFDMVYRSPLLQKVIESVTVNSESLARTFMLVAVVVYHFALLGQLFFREDYQWQFINSEGNATSVDLCATTMECVMTTFYLGLSYSGLAQGLDDVRIEWHADPQTARIRWLVDLLFFIIVIVMLLNIIFGIVIDTFAQQRDLQAKTKENMENVCFICGIDRNSFDRKHRFGYDHHIHHEHNSMHYLAFLVHLRTKNRVEYTGPETYVSKLLEQGDLSFFPILRTSTIVYEDEISNELLLESIRDSRQTLLAAQERIEAAVDANSAALANM